MELKFNLSFALHLGLFYYYFYLFLLWFGIYLHLVTANKILTNLLKAMLSFNHYYWSAFGEFMHIILHNLLSDEHVWAHPYCLTPPTGEE